LHDVGEQDGTSFLVMQYLEGETLEARLKKGARSLAQARQVAVQIADALAAAHKAGIVHRDLKPGNVMLTKSGAKLLDFGLAKTGAPVIGGVGLSGTFKYMAPEQLEGRRLTRGRTSSHSAPCCTRCSPGSGRLKETARRA
jgi:serine/threonine protein kinase